ncbi:MAG: DUF3109 family protein [Anaerolineaceae bacterium]|nr:DUF3109 family protein [Anaerolineaceae bacterium]
MDKRISLRLLKSEPMRRCELHECHAACCIHGVWIDLNESKEILKNADVIKKHLPDDRQYPQLWFDGREEADDHSISGTIIHSTVLPDSNHYGGTSCVFLRTDHKCALQTAGESAGFHRWHFKPFYCILHPLDLDEEGKITLDETDLLLDEPGSCLRPAENNQSFVVTFEEELRYFLGDKSYHKLIEDLKNNRTS